ncbi:hypothetical protein EC973_009120 [Apophysomyces ossiformis]|uniref:Protein UNC80 C-terminal domain-containing protein n=1 Tax=Apophysomyces ossiformis TaxID=679940 RepID=A0A8H7BRS4_9FUNG|nr:hypothetical protein EC973_009120 [Apophysomyces ossiformis]
MGDPESDSQRTVVSQPKVLPPLRNASRRDRNTEKKMQPASHWDKVREVMLSGPSTNGATVSANHQPSSTVHSPLPIPARFGQRNPILNAFSRSAPTAGEFSNHGDRFVAAAAAAAQVAGLSPFHSSNVSGRHMHMGGIYATTTAVQQDIYRLERALQKLILRLNVHTSQTNLATVMDSKDINGAVDSNAKRTRFQRQSKSDYFHTMATTSLSAEVMNEGILSSGTRIGTILSSIMELLHKHKQATRLPLAGEIHAILAIPFNQQPYNVEDCKQALDVFEYIRERFKQLTPDENFGQILFCVRLLDVRHFGLKMRIISMLKAILAPCMGSPNSLPSKPTTFHSLVFSLIKALAGLTSSESNEPKEADHIRASIIDFLDSLSNGRLIPITGDDWSGYFQSATAGSTSVAIPVSVAQFCVVEGICKALSTDDYVREDPYSDKELSQRQSSTLAIDKLILQDLLPRYWTQPSEDTRPAFLRIMFTLSESAICRFLLSNKDELDLPASSTSLLLYFVKNKLDPTALLPFLAESNGQHGAEASLMTMVLSMLAITSLESQRTRNPRASPNRSPQLSMHESWVDSVDSPFSGDSSGYASTQNFHRKSSQMNMALSIMKAYVHGFWNSGYRERLLGATASMLEDVISERTVCIYENLLFHIDAAVGECVAKETFQIFLDKIVASYPQATPSLCRLLSMVSKKYPTVFYKRVVSCVASNDERKVVRHLMLMTSLRRYLSGVQFWMQDPEMINVLFLSDVGKKQPNAHEEGSSLSLRSESGGASQVSKWGITTLGQCVVAAEFMWTIKELREMQKEGSRRNMEEDEIAKKFLIDLEKRLAVFITAKEKFMLVPLPLRVILCNVFLDVRLFCNTTHRPGWLTRVLEWATQPIVLPGTHFEASDEAAAQLHQQLLDDVTLMFQRLRIVYATAVDQFETEPNEMGDRTELSAFFHEPAGALDISEVRGKRYQSIATMYPLSSAAAASLSIEPSSIKEEKTDLGNLASILPNRRLIDMGKINQDPFGAVFSLLVAVYTAMTTQEFARLVRPLWERFIDERFPEAFVPAAFLLMQCGEKVPKLTIEITSQDCYSDNLLCRFSAVRKYAALTAFRFNVLTQEYIPVSSRRRPFRGDGGAFSTPFVPTDLGSNQFTMDEPRWMAKLKNASNFPIELKRQIQELGWDDDDQGEEHEAMKKVLTPLALLPSLFLEDEEDERMNDAENSNRGNDQGKKQVSISKVIARRKRASTIQSFTVAMSSLVDMLRDEDPSTRSAVRELLEHFIRDDPTTFLRAFLGDLGRQKLDRHRELLTKISYLVHMQAKLPPGFTHVLFNYLAGMLKWLTRESKEDGLVLMTLVHPILAELVFSTNELSTRDLRKNKIEHLLASTGRFWFIHEQPPDLFPRSLTNTKTSFDILDIPWQIFSVATLRISHIQFLTNFLIRYPREVYAVKKTIQDYEPIAQPGYDFMFDRQDELYFPNSQLRKRRDTDFVFEEGSSDSEEDDIDDRLPKLSQQKRDIDALSALRARVWLRFIDVLLNGLNKNYNDRMELERILKGINTIIIEHTGDFGIIGQALILYTRIVTRFKRLFVSNRGYSTFLPALFKVFCEVERYPHVRSAITFAWCRFYAIHEEAFVFQMLGTLVPLILSAYTKSVQLGAWMTNNIFVLMQAMHDPPRLGATSDVLGLQLQVELDDHERSIQERIDTVSNPMAVPLSTTILKPLARSVTSPITPLVTNNFANRPFPLQNFVKLFLTIIAYDPGSLRAEQFVRMFRYLLPRFCKLTSLKGLISEGIVALTDVFSKFSKNAKPATEGAAATASSPGPAAGERGGNGIGTGMHAANDRDQFQGRSAESAQHAYGKQWQQNDRITIKKEFVLLVHIYLKSGGMLTEINHEKMAMIIRMILRDHASLRQICGTDWIKDYLVDSLHSMVDMRNYTKAFKKLLGQIFTQYRGQWKIVDAADLYEGLALVLERGQGKAVNMHDIAGVIKERFVPFGLSIATTRSDWDNETGHTRFCHALVRLIVAIMENSTQDVLQEIEQLPTSVILLGKVVVPICLQYDLRWDHSPIMIRKYRPDPTANWMRLLGYISTACSQASLLKSKSSGFTLSVLSGMAAGQDSDQDVQDTKQSPTAVALMFALGFVAMKIILIRGAKSFDKMRGSWVQVAYFIKGALVFGQSLKSLRPKSTPSGRSTPNHAPPSSPNNNNLPPWSTPSSPALTPSGQSQVSLGVVYDFVTWRFLEFVVCYKSPLILFLRGFIHGKLRDIQTNQRNSLQGGRSTPRASMVIQSPPPILLSPPEQTDQTRPRWKSWGKGLPKDQNPANPISASDHHEASSPTCGLGLHIPRTGPSITSSPSISNATTNDWYEPEAEDQSRLHSRRGSHATTAPAKDLLVSTTVLHTIQSEAMMALVHVQLNMGYKPALPWMANQMNSELGPWSYRISVNKMSNEWLLLLQLFSETNELARTTSIIATPSQNNTA